MSLRFARVRVRLIGAFALALLLASSPEALAHGGGGGHGGGGHGSAGHGSSHASNGGSRGTGYHSGGGGSNHASSNSTWDPPVVNPYDLPSARFHRYLQHVFHPDQKGHA